MTQISTEDETTTFTIAHPRTFDGDPFEVAERAVRQAHAVSVVLDNMLDAAYKMARNAEMERAFIAHEEPQGSLFNHTPLGKRFVALTADVTKIRGALKGLAVAAGYNPRKPPKA
jgi:hypothetical protein